jgi:hypothetical protein
MDNAAAHQLAAATPEASTYLDGHHPVVRTRRGYCTEAASWFGQSLVTEAGAVHCQRLWDWLNTAVQHYWKDADLCLLASPGSTGRDLWLRTIDPMGKGWLLQADDVQQLVRDTAHQARIEVMPAPAGGHLAGLYEYDMRLAYLAVSRQLPTGRPVWHHTMQADAQTTRLPSRWWVTFTVPRGWNQVGLLPVMHSHGGWHYPTAGTHDAVVDGCELSLAVEHGWHITVQRTLVWPERCDPYRLLFGRLLRIISDSGRLSPLSQRMVRAAVRAIALHTIGAMHGAPHKVTRRGTVDEMPADAEQVRIEADGLMRWVQYDSTAWAETSHPEWTAHLWARARYRLLQSPGGAGMLTLPAGTVVAVRTDAIYTTIPTGWDASDDGQPGRWVLKRQRTGQLRWPNSHSELLVLRSGGE